MIYVYMSVVLCRCDHEYSRKHDCYVLKYIVIGFVYRLAQFMVGFWKYTHCYINSWRKFKNLHRPYWSL